MKFRFKYVQAGILIFFFVISSACQKQKSGWQGTIEEKNGIRIVKNPAEPMFGELVLELEEDLSIGSVEDENTMFFQIGDMAVDSQGNLYVLDSGNHRIQKFDKDGNYLQTIGRKGQGPGEFMSPYDIFLDERGNIYVSEGRRMNLFDAKGNSIKSFVITSFIMGFSVGSEGNIIAYGFVRAERGQNFGILTIDSEGKVTKTVAEFQGMKSVTRGDTIFSLSHEYTPFLSFSSVGQNRAVYGYTPEYTLYLTDRLGEILLIIKKDEPHHSITRKEKDKIIDEALEGTARDGRRWPRDVVEEGANFPDHRPFFRDISSDDKGRIFVQKRKPVLDESEEAEFDIFSADGYYLYTTTLSFTPTLIKDGYLYKTSYSEETGEYKIIRYKIKNWDKIKEGIS